MAKLGVQMMIFWTLIALLFAVVMFFFGDIVVDLLN